MVMVPKKIAEAWVANAEQETRLDPKEAYEHALRAAEEAYCSALEELGMSGEYAAFPKIKGCSRGPFDPRATE